MSPALLTRARSGDQRAFGELVEPYRRELHLHCYRILGSLGDAEDAVQETMLAAWRGLPAFEGRSSVRGWLYRIATNRCLNALRDAGRRPPVAPVPPFQAPEPTRHGETTWLQPCPDTLLEPVDHAPGPEARYQSREAVELAFVEALQRLPPRQAAALVLRDVLGFPAASVAAMLGTSPTAVKGALQRARASLSRHRRDGAGGRSPAPGSARERELTGRFAAAFVADDIDAVVALLTDDAWLAMPPAPHEYRGAVAIAGFLRASAGWRSGRPYQLVPTRANGQPAFGCYLPADGGVGWLAQPAHRPVVKWLAQPAHRPMVKWLAQPAHRPAGLIVLTLAGDRIGRITRFLDDELFPRFGLPPTLPATATVRPGRASAAP